MNDVVEKVNFKYKGWFCTCPVYLNYEDGSDEITSVAARYDWLEYWFDFNELMYSFLVDLRCSFDPEYEPMYPFTITGEVNIQR